jgi:hypothetical protein
VISVASRLSNAAIIFLRPAGGSAQARPDQTKSRGFTSPLLIAVTEGEELGFAFEYRTRRPATDPVNAMLSFAYAMLVRELTANLVGRRVRPSRVLPSRHRLVRRAKEETMLTGAEDGRRWHRAVSLGSSLVAAQRFIGCIGDIADQVISPLSRLALARLVGRQRRRNRRGIGRNGSIRSSASAGRP